MKTRACRAFSRREILLEGDDRLDVDGEEPVRAVEAYEKHELELEERELERESEETAESGDSERAGGGKRSMTGVAQVGALTSSAIIANISSSSALSLSRSC